MKTHRYVETDKHGNVTRLDTPKVTETHELVVVRDARACQMFNVPM
jgi:hypothetical protein